MSNDDWGLQFTIDRFSTFTILHMAGLKVQDGRHTPYIKGYSDGLFKPEGSTSRAELAAMLVRLGAAETALQGAAFPDVDANHWAFGFVSQVKAAGLMKGYSDGQFKPSRKVTREELAAVLYNYLNLSAITTTADFTDVAADYWANAIISAVSAEGVMQGYADGSFRPKQELTRAETVSILNRVFDRGPLYGTKPSWPDVSESYWAYRDIEEASREHAAAL